MIIEEALENLSTDELAIHEKLKDITEDALFEYVLKRQFYKEPSIEELDHINDLYEDGETFFNVKFNGKEHRFKLLSQYEKTEIDSILDEEFSGKEAKRKFVSEELKNKAMLEFRIVATLAASVVSIAGDNITQIVADSMVTNKWSLIKAKTYWVERLPFPLIKSLYDRYVDFETRIYDIFQYESIRKK